MQQNNYRGELQLTKGWPAARAQCVGFNTMSLLTDMVLFLVMLMTHDAELYQCAHTVQYVTLLRTDEFTVQLHTNHL